MVKSIYILLSYFAKNKYIRKINKSLELLKLTSGITLIDVGAAGEIMPRWKRIEKHLNYHGFEPDERSRKSLLNKPNKCISYNIHDNLVGNHTYDMPLHLCSSPMNSSTLIPNKTFNQLFPNKERFNVTHSIELPTSTLDLLELSEIDFIKLDIQGGELNALKGAKDSLKKVIALEIEIEFQPIYKDQPLFDDINSYLQKHNFEFIDFPRLVRWGRDNIFTTVGQCVWGDALFMRTPESIIRQKDDIELVKKYLAICLLYHRYDYISVIENLLKTNIDPLFFKKAEILKKKFYSNQLIKRRLNNVLNLFRFFDEEIYSLH